MEAFGRPDLPHFHSSTLPFFRSLPVPPRVSICIPTFNGAAWICESVRSALQQAYDSFEVVVVDDHSTDETVDAARAVEDERLRILVNERRLGMVENWNECIRQARGDLVKFLFQDDLLRPDCVARMAALFEGSEEMGMVFSRREILLEDPADAEAVAWRDEFGALHRKFERLAERNRGRELFEQYLRAGFRENWVGEPTCVMVRRDCFRRLGGFNVRMRQGCDFEMWIRLMFTYDVGFVDEPLAVFRVHRRSTTAANTAADRGWLDLVWLMDGLLAHAEIRLAHPEIRKLRLLEGARVAKRQWERLRRRGGFDPAGQARSLAEYVGYRLGGAVGRAPALHPEI